MKEDDGKVKTVSEAALTRERIIKRAALEFKDGMYGIFSKMEEQIDRKCYNF